ncbi:hypothetical protein OA92_03905 [Marinomonas sp. SBI22]|uniref:CBS domain-containing protein n=1 Tax=unclassified Marinomonas TaxID=196814 RepID=UPI0007AFC385|nr:MULTISPECIES: CBS domain-containing protein [unclassified Marinomonas]KZM45010.1 hypothetical protein OA92_03905 [Marinomonas sp. SBI22]KZM46709.1 hypothetical protein OA91_02965 [Marinomonas sp. SBI8L]
MNNLTVMLSISSFLIIIVFIVIMRHQGKEIVIKSTDLVLALIPILIYLFLSGQIKSITVGDFSLVSALKKASLMKVEKSVTQLPVDIIPVGDKSTYEKIPYLIKSQVVGLKFKMGYEGYDADQIKYYVESLGKYTFFKYLIIENESGHFVAISNIEEFYKPYNKIESENNVEKLILAIESNSVHELLKVSNFVQDSININTEKRDALKKMQINNTKSLPVVGNSMKLIGVVTQENLAASLVVEIADQVNR